MKAFLRKIKYFYLKIIKKILWRKKNKHNFLKIRSSNYNTLDINKIKCGKCSYGLLNVEFYGNINEYLEIGSFCSIAPNVVFLLGGNHNYSCISTYPFDNFIFNKKEMSFSKGPIIVKNDVWIGSNSIILSGITIGQGSIIAAGSVVTKSTPPYSIVAGNPAVVKKYRFNNDIINKLLEVDIDDLDKIDRFILYTNINEKSINEIIQKINYKIREGEY